MTMLPLFLIPLILSILWFTFLQYNGLTLQQGKKGFYYIIGGTSMVIAFLTLMMYLTN